MICERCHWLKKEHHVDEEDNIHISWSCEKRGINLFYQVIRSKRFLERNPYMHKIVVLQRPDMKGCTQFMEKSHTLTEFIKPEE